MKSAPYPDADGPDGRPVVWNRRQIVIALPSPLPSPYPAHERRPTRGVNPLTRQRTTANCE
jgi:hypothetical protein